MSATLDAFRNNEIVTINGVDYRMAFRRDHGDRVHPGDLYYGESEKSNNIRVVRKVRMGCVFPTEFGVAYQVENVVGIFAV